MVKVQVKDYWDEWDRIIFQDRCILRKDLKLLSGAQVGELSRKEVMYVDHSDKQMTLILVP